MRKASRSLLLLAGSAALLTGCATYDYGPGYYAYDESGYYSAPSRTYYYDDPPGYYHGPRYYYGPRVYAEPSLSFGFGYSRSWRR